MSREMMLYALLIYILLLLFSLVFFFVKKLNISPFQITFALPQKKSFMFFFPEKVRVYHFITLYECPECGYKSMEKSKVCPLCKVEGKEAPLVANTIPFRADFQ